MSNRSRIVHLVLGSLLMVLSVVALRPSAALAEPTTEPVRDQDPFQVLPEILTPKRIATEAERNRVIATRILTKARILEQRGEKLAALRAYQQAYRLTPETVSIVQEIIQLQLELRLVDEASRYSVLLAERKEGLPAEFLVEVANHCIREGELVRAANLLDKAIALRMQEGAHTDVLGLRLRALQLFTSADKKKQAAEHATAVLSLLTQPEKYDLDLSAIEAAPESWRRTYLELARVQLAAENWDQAEEAFHRAEEIHPVAGGADLHRAEWHIAQGDFPAAQPHLEGYFSLGNLEEGKRAYELLRDYLTAVLPDLDQVDQALIDRLEPLRKDREENADLTTFLTQVHLRQESWDKVIEIASPTLNEDTPAKTLAALAKAYYQQRDWAGLLSVLELTADESLDLSPLGEVAETIAEDAEALDALLKQVEEVASNSKTPFPPFLALGKLYQISGDFERAATWTEQAGKRAKRNIRSQILLTLGLDAIRADNGEIAERVLRAALDGRPRKEQLPLLQFYLAAALEMQDKHDDALRSVKRAALLNEDSALLRSRIAWLLYHKGELEEAKEEYQRLLERFDKDPSDSQTRTVMREARSVLSSLALKEGRFDDSIAWLEEILNEYPEDVGIMNDVGYLWVDRNQNLGRAFLMIERALDADPDNYAFRDSMGWAHYRLGNYEQAVVELQKAVDGLEKLDAVVLDHLADAHLKLGNRDKAALHWRQAIDLARKDGDTDLVPKLEEKLEQLATTEVSRGS
ncbi:MAG: tetratricopeptide repeat protein [Pirellulaceae bacterium]